MVSVLIQGDPSLQTLQLRGGGGDTFLAGAQLVKEILKAIGVFTESDKKDGWDFKDNKDMCDVFFTTKNGGNCFVTVECNDGGKKEIGEFSVNFTKRDGWELQGLTNPILQVKHVADWKEWDVSSMSSARAHANLCEKGISPLGCHKGPWVEGGNTPIVNDCSKRWSCVVPKIEAKFPDGSNWEKNN
ncbi:uncharacterized protein JN550_002088 [Neoarthrinium moseri]|uniref:uncharacterized protein n=1 Tax=Neoarthrinium moseri TaxID=1658444 RepID=UPI001FDCC449|nr:uncharacterized protein JN550_002088 [Neoarthrinium moseri]KAI1875802.1 hypothetical protein JN550_002088 [Neoarthrinium moseri]